MDKSIYIKNLVSLYESSKLSEQEIDPNQVKIADSGRDVNDVSLNSQGVNQDFAGLGMGDPNAGMDPALMGNLPVDDMSYLSTDSQPEEERSNEVDSDVSEEKKLLKLHDYFKDLIYYCEKFKDSLIPFIDEDTLEDEEIIGMRKYLKRLDNEADKVSNYLTYNFGKDKYEKSLYTYILLRTELLMIIRALRKVLRLNDPDEAQTGKNGQK